MHGPLIDDKIVQLFLHGDPYLRHDINTNIISLAQFGSWGRGLHGQQAHCRLYPLGFTPFIYTGHFRLGRFYLIFYLVRMKLPCRVFPFKVGTSVNASSID